MDPGALLWVPQCDALARASGASPHALLRWLLEARTWQEPTLSEQELPARPWQSFEEGIQGLEKIDLFYF